MSSFERRALLMGLAAFGLTGCQIRPLYAPGPGAPDVVSQVFVESPPGRDGYYYQRALRRRFGEAAPDAPWRLVSTLSFERESASITVEADVTRYDVIGRARYALIARGQAEPTREGVVEAQSAYNTLAAPYSEAVAERDAQRRISETLAQRVFLAVAGAMPEQAPT